MISLRASLESIPFTDGIFKEGGAFDLARELAPEFFGGRDAKADDMPDVKFQSVLYPINLSPNVLFKIT